LNPIVGRVPEAVFGEPFVPPVSDGSGSDRNCSAKARRSFRKPATCEEAWWRLPEASLVEQELELRALLSPTAFTT